MNTVLRPVGPQPARIYWVRRLVLLAAFVAAVVLVVALAGRGGAADADGDSGAVSASGSEDDGSEGSGDAGDETDGADGDADGAAADGAPAACAPQSLTVTLTADATSYAADATPTFTVSFTNTSSESCVIDAGAANQALVVTSGSDRIWSSADCPAEGGTRTLLLAPGAQDQDAIAWPRVRSDETCSTDLPAPRSGTYSAVAVLGGAQSGSVVFDLG